jgi:hypothetical protein
MDAMSEKRLGSGALFDGEGCPCTLGVIAQARGADVERYAAVNPDYLREVMEELFSISEAMGAEIMHENDEGTYSVESPEVRWRRMRAWVQSKIRSTNDP